MIATAKALSLSVPKPSLPSPQEFAEYETRLAGARLAESKIPSVERFVEGRRVVWAPQPGSQEAFLSCPFFEILYHGTRGGGKSDSLLMKFAQHVGRGYGAAWRGVIFRETYPQLADMVAKSERWFRQIFPGAKFNKQGMSWTWPTGEVLFFRHMRVPEDYWNFHGHEIPFIAWEELANWADDRCYRSMFSCCRSSNPDVPRMVCSTTNPYGKGHNWIKDRFRLYGRWWETIVIIDATDDKGRAEPPRVAIHSHIDENKILLQADPLYLQNISAAAQNSAMADAWLSGSWAFVAGGMFSDVWSPTYNHVPRFIIPPTWRIDRGFDWGSSKPFSVGWYAQSDGCDLELSNRRIMATVKGDLFRVREWYGWTGRPNEGKRMLASEITEGIVERELAWEWRNGDFSRVKAGPADASIYKVENGNCIATDMQKPVRINGRSYRGVEWTPSDKSPGSRKNGWELMRKMIKAAQPKKAGSPRESPGFFVVGDECPQFLRTVLSASRDEKDMDDIDCFVAGTLVATPLGWRAIELIGVGDVVETPIGPRAVRRSYLSGASKTIRVVLSNGQVLQGTARHKIFVPGVGLVRLDAISCGLVLTQETTWEVELHSQIEAMAFSLPSLVGSSTGSIRRADISSAGVQTRSWSKRFCIEPSGFTIVDRSLMGFMCTTRTRTRSTTDWSISNSSRRVSTRGFISKVDGHRSMPACESGDPVLLGRSSFEATLRRCWPTRRLENLRATIVDELLSRSIQVRSIATSDVPMPMGQECSRSLAPSAKRSSSASHTRRARSRPAPIRVVGIFADATPRNVYNLTVDEAGLYFAAGGILCSNTDSEDHCADECRYKIRSLGRVAGEAKTSGYY